MRRRHRAGLFLGVLLALGFAIWQPWRGSHLEAPTARTIVLLTIDALRRDHVGAYAPSAADVGARTPQMDALAAEGVRFDDARTMVPLTLPSHATMLTGRTPARTGVRVNSQPLAPAGQRAFRTLPERLRRAGWRTGAFVSAETLAPRYGLDAGFEVYDAGGLAAPGGGGLSVPERPGGRTIAAALAFLSSVRSGARVFLFVHLFEPHFPYRPTYRDDCETADGLVGRLREGLRRRGRGNAAILLTADHGEALGELNERTHGILLQDGVMRVPLIVRVPGRPAGVRGDPVTVADLAPTIADLAGLQAERRPEPWAARSLLGAPFPPDRPRVAESLYGHHRFRWAQLSAAVVPAGELVDAGAGRAWWLPRMPFGVDLLGPRPSGEAPPEGAGLYRTLGAYRSSEVPEAMSEAYGISGYGAGGQVAPFLSGPENARLPDPHARVSAADTLSDLAGRTAAARRAAEILPVIAALERMARVDPGNPEVWFRLARAWHRAALLGPGTGADTRRARQGAETAAQRAWEAGRRDEGTLILWVGSNAKGREADMCARLETEGRQIRRWTFQLWLLRAILLRARIEAGETGLEAQRAEACRQAAALAKTARDRKRLADAGCA